MVESQQPYRPPGARMGPRPGAPSGGGALSVRTIASMEKTRPWVRFIAAMMLLGSAILVLLGIVMLVMGRMAGAAGELGGIGGAALGAAYLFLALLYVAPALYLWRYGGAIKQIGRSNTVAFEEALEHQASFWRFVGIVTAVVVVIYAIAIVAAGILGVMTATSAGS
jgi:hypothetical protein